MVVSLKDFMFKDNFNDITDADITMASTRVLGLFTGIKTMWSPEACSLTEEERYAKRFLCYNYLIAWQLVTSHPGKGRNVSGTGGMPILEKKAHDVHIKYRNTVRQEGVLSMLTTNSYGLQALEMIQSAPENYMMYGRV